MQLSTFEKILISLIISPRVLLFDILSENFSVLMVVRQILHADSALSAVLFVRADKPAAIVV